MKKTFPIVLRVLVSAILIFLVFWFTLPPLNVFSTAFWKFVCWSMVIVIAVNFTGKIVKFFRDLSNGEIKKPTVKRSLKSLGVPLLSMLGAFAVIAVFSIVFNVS